MLAHGTPVAERVAMAALPVLTETVTMLVVDDESVIRFAFQSYFAQCGFVVDVAAERDQAFLLIDANRYDVVVADLRLMGTDSREGLDVIRHARAKDERMAIVLLSAYGSSEVRDAARAAGADVMLQKPKPLPVVAAAVIELLAAKRA
jgi:DNA-binding response OmpR family regulator